MLKEKILELFSKHYLALSIIFIGLIIRLFFIYFQGLSNDELSGVMRCHFPDFKTLIQEGVRNGDMHPAFYQVFMWFWMKFFGESELGIRTLSLFFFLLNMGLFYTIACRFFSRNQGIMVLVFYASFTFLIINTTFSRPYNSGTFFLLLLTYSILNYQKSENKFSISFLGIVLAFTGAMYSHYFAFLTAGVIGFCSLFYLDRSKKIHLLIAGFIAILLFLPHLEITLHQLGNGGLGWLGKPNKLWLLDFFIYFFNQSKSLFLFVTITLIFFHIKYTSKWSKEERFFSYIFSLTYLVGHLLSVFYTPILRELVMLFLMPFLLLVLLRPIKVVSKDSTTKIALVTILIIGIHSISYGSLFKPKNFPVFREIGELGNKFDTKFGRQNITYISSFNSIDYINYYRTNKLIEQQKDWNANAIYTLFERIKASRTPYFVYHYSNHFHSILLYELIRKVYPQVLFHKTYFNSGFTFFSKKGNSNYGLIKKQIIRSLSETIESEAEFFGNQKVDVKTLRQHLQKSDYLLLECFGQILLDRPFYMVAVLENKGKMLKNNPLHEMYVALNQTKVVKLNCKEKFVLAFELPVEAKDDDEVHFYFWNPEKIAIKVKSPIWSVVQTKL
jgi:hypothetical protein